MIIIFIELWPMFLLDYFYSQSLTRNLCAFAYFKWFKNKYAYY